MLLNLSKQSKKLEGVIKSDSLHSNDLDYSGPFISALNSIYGIFKKENDPSFLGGNEVFLNFKIGSLKNKNFVIEDFDAILEVVDNTIKLKPILGLISQGKLNGSLTLERLNNVFKLGGNIIVSGLDYSTLFNQKLDDNDISNDIDFLVKLNSIGSNYDELYKSLKGSISLAGGQRELSSDVLNNWASGLSDKLGLESLNDGALNLECLLINAELDSKVIKTDAIFLDASKVSLQGEGVYDFTSGHLDMLLESKHKSDNSIKDVNAVNISGLLDKLLVSSNANIRSNDAKGLLSHATNPKFNSYNLNGLEINEQHPCKGYVITREALEDPFIQD